MKQMTLWDVDYDTITHKNNLDPPQISEADNRKMKPCSICGVLPEIRNGRTAGYMLARCPRCGYQCGTLYDIGEHWNRLQEYRMKEWRKNDR